MNGRDKDNILFIYIKPTYSSLNYNEQILKSIYYEYAYRKFLNIDQHLRITHIVYTASGENKYEYNYPSDLLYQSTNLLDNHFMNEFEDDKKRLKSTLVLIYKCVYDQLTKTKQKINLKSYQTLSKKILIDERSQLAHIGIMDTKIFNQLYLDISKDLTPDIFKTKILSLEDY